LEDASVSHDPASGYSCPLPDLGDGARITLAHGEGGRLTRQLIADEILPELDNPRLLSLGDAATLPNFPGPVAMTTDSFVVSPLFFPGGDIGSLAVYGTVNDLAVSGARPRWLSLAMILEEGLPVETLRRILRSVARAARDVGVEVVTGDTKVVPRGAADGLFLNTAGVGELIAPVPPGPAALEPGDQLLVSGPIGRHGMAVLVSREGLEFDPAPSSDSGPLADAVAALRRSGIAVRAMRDATRGGLAAVLHEWAEASRLTCAIAEADVPVTSQVRGACEVLGLDPAYVANEGTMVVAVAPDCVTAALQALREVPQTSAAAWIGLVRKRDVAPVVVRRALGQEIPLDEPAGAPLPRIC
jgi:hydrogenase expression/formation protein HypE